MSSNIRNVIEGKKSSSSWGKFFMGVYKISFDTSSWVNNNILSLRYYLLVLKTIIHVKRLMQIQECYVGLWLQPV